MSFEIINGCLYDGSGLLFDANNVNVDVPVSLTISSLALRDLVETADDEELKDEIAELEEQTDKLEERVEELEECEKKMFELEEQVEEFEEDAKSFEKLGKYIDTVFDSLDDLIDDYDSEEPIDELLKRMTKLVKAERYKIYEGKYAE